MFLFLLQSTLHSQKARVGELGAIYDECTVCGEWDYEHMIFINEIQKIALSRTVYPAALQVAFF